MTQWFRKVKAGLVKSDINNFVGEKGNTFFNVTTGEFRLSDGITPGGLPITNENGSNPILLTIEQNGEEKGSANRINFVNSSVTIVENTANITSSGTTGSIENISNANDVDTSNLDNGSLLIYNNNLNMWVSTTDLNQQSMDGGFY